MDNLITFFELFWVIGMVPTGVLYWVVCSNDSRRSRGSVAGMAIVTSIASWAALFMMVWALVEKFRESLDFDGGFG